MTRVKKERKGFAKQMGPERRGLGYQEQEIGKKKEGLEQLRHEKGQQRGDLERTKLGEGYSKEAD